MAETVTLQAGKKSLKMIFNKEQTLKQVVGLVILRNSWKTTKVEEQSMSQGSYAHQNPSPPFSSGNLCASFTLQQTF